MNYFRELRSMGNMAHTGPGKWLVFDENMHCTQFKCRQMGSQMCLCFCESLHL